jgi:hypothetical protein
MILSACAVSASLNALAQPQPPARLFSDEEMREILAKQNQNAEQLNAVFSGAREAIRMNLERAYSRERAAEGEEQGMRADSEDRRSQEMARFQARVEAETEKVASLVERAQHRAQTAAQRALHELEAAGKESEARHAAEQAYYRELWKEWCKTQEEPGRQKDSAQSGYATSTQGQGDGASNVTQAGGVVPASGDEKVQGQTTSDNRGARSGTAEKQRAIGPTFPGGRTESADRHFSDSSRAMHPAEIDDLHNQRLFNELLPDGARAYTTGYHHTPAGVVPEDVIQVLGIRVEPHQAQASAEILAQATRRPVTNIMNHSAVSEYGEWVGSAVDASNAMLDRVFEGGPGREAAEQTVKSETLKRLLEGRSATFVVHSQGSVIAQRGIAQALSEIDRMHSMNQLSAEERNSMVGRIKVVAVGALAHRDRWDTRIKVHHANNPDDIVPIIGGNVPLSEVQAPDPTLRSHRYEGYVPDAADALNNNP